MRVIYEMCQGIQKSTSVSVNLDMSCTVYIYTYTNMHMHTHINLYVHTYTHIAVHVYMNSHLLMEVGMVRVYRILRAMPQPTINIPNISFITNYGKVKIIAWRFYGPQKDEHQGYS